ncbi:uncharacterized protein LOC106469148 [Limulus polyphemus]|uniref:Uncharacterized protein LOC106469148 n=1 Tax=Limulus polyphemus TaxID=6850 RepID=A0ABM1BMM0_LIMPO|nr:uncharacterized protein LOC106469148 [Limulus polyphemus]XP_022253285.1 uncharacterized protein LOC106469148 [Limulus polyphemus]
MSNLPAMMPGISDKPKPPLPPKPAILSNSHVETSCSLSTGNFVNLSISSQHDLKSVPLGSAGQDPDEENIITQGCHPFEEEGSNIEHRETFTRRFATSDTDASSALSLPVTTSGLHDLDDEGSNEKLACEPIEASSFLINCLSTAQGMVTNDAEDVGTNTQQVDSRRHQENPKTLESLEKQKEDYKKIVNHIKESANKDIVKRAESLRESSSNALSLSHEVPHSRFYRSLSGRLPKRTEEPESGDEVSFAGHSFVSQKQALKLMTLHTKSKLPPTKPPKPSLEALAKAKASREAPEGEARLRGNQTQKPRPRSFGEDIPVSKGVIQFIDDSASEISSDYPDVDLYQFITIKNQKSNEADLSDSGLYEGPNISHSIQQVSSPVSKNITSEEDRKCEIQTAVSQSSSVLPSSSSSLKDKFLKSCASSKCLQTEGSFLEAENISTNDQDTVKTKSFESHKSQARPVKEVKSLKEIVQENLEVESSLTNEKEMCPESISKGTGLPKIPVPPLSQGSGLSTRPVPPLREGSGLLVRPLPLARLTHVPKIRKEEQAAQLSSEEKDTLGSDVNYSHFSGVQDHFHQQQKTDIHEKFLMLSELIDTEKTSFDFEKKTNEVKVDKYAEETLITAKFHDETRPVEEERKLLNMKKLLSTKKPPGERQVEDVKIDAKPNTLLKPSKPAVPPRPKKFGPGHYASPQDPPHPETKAMAQLQKPARPRSPSQMATSPHLVDSVIQLPKPTRPDSPSQKVINKTKPVHKVARPTSPINSPANKTRRPTSPVNKLRSTSPYSKKSGLISSSHKANRTPSLVNKKENEQLASPTSKSHKPVQPHHPIGAPFGLDKHTIAHSEGNITSDILEVKDQSSKLIKFSEKMKSNTCHLTQKPEEIVSAVCTMNLSPRVLHSEPLLRNQKSVTFVDENSSSEVGGNFEKGVKWRTYRTASGREKKRPHTVVLPVLKNPYLQNFQIIPSSVSKPSSLPHSSSENKTLPEHPPPPKVKGREDTAIRNIPQQIHGISLSNEHKSVLDDSKVSNDNVKLEVKNSNLLICEIASNGDEGIFSVIDTKKIIQENLLGEKTEEEKCTLEKENKKVEYVLSHSFNTCSEDKISTNTELSQSSKPQRPLPPDYNSLRKKINYYEQIQNSHRYRIRPSMVLEKTHLKASKTEMQPRFSPRVKRQRSRTVEIISSIWKRDEKKNCRSKSLDENDIMNKRTDHEVLSSSRTPLVVSTQSQNELQRTKCNSAIGTNNKFHGYTKMKFSPLPIPSLTPTVKPRGFLSSGEDEQSTHLTYTGYSDSSEVKELKVKIESTELLNQSIENHKDLVTSGEFKELPHTEHILEEQQLGNKNHINHTFLEDGRKLQDSQVDESARTPYTTKEMIIQSKTDNKHHSKEVVADVEGSKVQIANSVFYSQEVPTADVEPVQRRNSKSFNLKLEENRKTKWYDKNDISEHVKVVKSDWQKNSEEHLDNKLSSSLDNSLKLKEGNQKKEHRTSQFFCDVPEDLLGLQDEAKNDGEHCLSPDRTEKSVQTVSEGEYLLLKKKTEQSDSENIDELVQDLKNELKKKGYDEKEKECPSQTKIRFSFEIVSSEPETEKRREEPLHSDKSSVFEISWQEDDSSEDSDELSSGVTTEEAAARKKKKRVFYIAQEIMTSEMVFVDTLRLLNEDFRRAVEEAEQERGTSVIPEDVLNQLLKYFPQLENLNKKLLRELQERIEHWPETGKISDIFVTLGPFLKLYSSYFRDFNLTTALLDECRKKFPVFAEVVKEFETSPRCKKLSLSHYMLKPVQRIPQYRLLLQDYLHHLPEDSLDYEDTVIALEIVSQVADHANETMKQGDNITKLMSIQNSIYGHHEVIQPGRVFIKEGELMKLSRKIMQPRWFILFNDSLWCMTQVQYNLYRVHHELPLTGMKVSIPIQQDYQNEFSIISVTRSFILAACSPEARDEWINTLNKAIEENACKRSTFLNVRLHQKNGEVMPLEDSSFDLGRRAPVWIPDARVTMCQLCTSEFTVTFRRHHCRACGKVVCSACSVSRAPLHYLGLRPARVCDSCFQKLQQEFSEGGQAECPVTMETGDSVGVLESGETEIDTPQSVAALKAQFKGNPRHLGKKVKRILPSVLIEVCANDQGSSISGYLQKRCRRGWKRYWFVIKDKVLYRYKASEDIAALASIPLLGYSVDTFTEPTDGVDSILLFQLTHPGQPPIMFHADTSSSAERWVRAMRESTVLE